MQTAAKAGAPPAPAVQVSGSHTFVAMETFNFVYNGCHLTYHQGQRYIVETPLKNAISATDKDVVWDN
jgi:hypothetical protein